MNSPCVGRVKMQINVHSSAEEMVVRLLREDDFYLVILYAHRKTSSPLMSVDHYGETWQWYFGNLIGGKWSLHLATSTLLCISFNILFLARSLLSRLKSSFANGALLYSWKNCPRWNCERNALTVNWRIFTTHISCEQ